MRQTGEPPLRTLNQKYPKHSKYSIYDKMLVYISSVLSLEMNGLPELLFVVVKGNMYLCEAGTLQHFMFLKFKTVLHFTTAHLSIKINSINAVWVIYIGHKQDSHRLVIRVHICEQFISLLCMYIHSQRDRSCMCTRQSKQNVLLEDTDLS